MTVIVAATAADGSVVLAADDVGWWGDAVVPAPHKLFHPRRADGLRGRHAQVAIGVAGSARVSRVMRRHLQVERPEPSWDDERLDEWAEDVSVAAEDLALGVPPVPGDDRAREYHAILAARGRWWLMLEPGSADGERGRRPVEAIGAAADLALGFLVARATGTTTAASCRRPPSRSGGPRTPWRRRARCTCRPRWTSPAAR